MNKIYYLSAPAGRHDLKGNKGGEDVEPSEKLDILIDLYRRGELDEEDYIRLRKQIEMAIDRQKRKKAENGTK